jgi:4-aminobutyrate aminotransferase-like enzyme
MAAAIGVLDVIENEKSYLHIQRNYEYLMAELSNLKDKYTFIGDIRGKGYFIGVDFVKSRESREPNTELAKIVLYEYLNIFLLHFY